MCVKHADDSLQKTPVLPWRAALCGPPPGRGANPEARSCPTVNPDFANPNPESGGG